jgi:hypothetical protein
MLDICDNAFLTVRMADPQFVV